MPFRQAGRAPDGAEPRPRLERGSRHGRRLHALYRRAQALRNHLERNRARQMARQPGAARSGHEHGIPGNEAGPGARGRHRLPEGRGRGQGTGNEGRGRDDGHGSAQTGSRECAARDAGPLHPALRRHLYRGDGRRESREDLGVQLAFQDRYQRPRSRPRQAGPGRRRHAG